MPYKDITEKRRKDREYWLKVKGAGPASVSAAQNRAIDVVQHIKVAMPAHGLKIAYVPDAQAMPGVRLDHLSHAGQYIASKRPDVIVCGGDFGDFPSLSRFGRGERKFEGRRYKADVAAFHQAMELFMTPIAIEKEYHPSLHFLLGNHEDHITRITQEHAFLDGVISVDDLCLPDYGWIVHEFMQPIAIGGVAFCHYFPSGVRGQPITTAREILNKLHMSAVAGHQQGRDIAYGKRADGRQMTAIISGSFYQHDMEYLSPFTNKHWRGMWMLHQVKNGEFDEMALSIDFLKRRFGPVK
jgi:hypothetical protein